MCAFLILDSALVLSDSSATAFCNSLMDASSFLVLSDLGSTIIHLSSSKNLLSFAGVIVLNNGSYDGSRFLYPYLHFIST